jgi:hypothetical protein
MCAVLFASSVLLLWPRSAAAQLGPCATPVGPQTPDLISDGQLLKTQMYVSEEQFNANSCAVVEGVVSKPGKQTLLRFNSSTANIGKTDMYIGDPAQCPALFEFSPCHQHLHFKQYAAYRLWTPAGYANWLATRDVNAPADSGTNAQLLAAAVASGDLISGHKQGFCMVDSAPYPGANNPGPATYLSCSSNQGISVGWEDIYPPQLPDQFIEISGLAEGSYVLENQVNPNLILPESDYTNNSAAVFLYYTPKHGNQPASVQVIQ